MHRIHLCIIYRCIIYGDKQVGWVGDSAGVDKQPGHYMEWDAQGLAVAVARVRRRWRGWCHDEEEEEEDDRRLSRAAERGVGIYR